MSSDVLAQLGWDERIVVRCPASAAPGTVPGRVVLVVRGGGFVATATGEHRARSRSPLAVGDWVAVQAHNGEAVVVAVADRWSQLTRRDPEGLIQVLAANVDVVLVTAPADRLSINRVEREVALAWDGGARPVVLLTKADLAAPGQNAELQRRLVGVEVIETSTVTAAGLDQIRALLQPARTAVLLGPSGAGKSSIVNSLLHEQRSATRPVRSSDRRGRHTTNVRELFIVPTGGCIIDTPGLRSLSLVADQTAIASTFPDVATFANACRFRDCQHEHEPGCAVVAAAADGHLDPDRLASFKKLQRELDFEYRRDDPLARENAERIWKIRAKQARQLRSFERPRLPRAD